MPVSKYKLIVLDWDGTVMDSLGVIVACAQEGARDLDLPVPSDTAIRDLVGLRLDTMAEHLFPHHGELRSDWTRRYSHHWIHTFHHRLQLLPESKAAIEHLFRDQYFLAVATGKSRRGLRRDFESTGLGPRFLTSRTVDESPSKPSPGMLLEIMDELGVGSEQTLMVGDTTHDLQMANNASVDSLAVLSGSHDRQTLMAENPVACLDHIGLLPAWLARD